jgi:hypothetical protein
MLLIELREEAEAVVFRLASIAFTLRDDTWYRGHRGNRGAARRADRGAAHRADRGDTGADTADSIASSLRMNACSGDS